MKKITIKWIAGFLTIAMAFVLVGVALLYGESASGRPAQQEATLSPEEAEIARLRSLLEGEGLSAEARRSLEEKLQMAERMAADKGGQPDQTRSTKVPPPLPQTAQYDGAPAPGEDLLEGIFEGSGGIIRPSVADINNLWQGTRNGKEYQVFAGAFSEEIGGGGVVIVIDLMPSDPIAGMQSYPAPEGSGSLRIVAVEESVVVLENEAGDRLFFDLESRSYK